MCRRWLPLAVSLAAGCGLPRRTAGPRGPLLRVGNSWLWTQLPDCKSSTIVPPHCAGDFVGAGCYLAPLRKCCTTYKEWRRMRAIWRRAGFWWIQFPGGSRAVLRSNLCQQLGNRATTTIPHLHCSHDGEEAATPLVNLISCAMSMIFNLYLSSVFPSVYEISYIHSQF